jgi:hypothetical protein
MTPPLGKRCHRLCHGGLINKARGKFHPGSQIDCIPREPAGKRGGGLDLARLPQTAAKAVRGLREPNVHARRLFFWKR